MNRSIVFSPVVLGMVAMLAACGEDEIIVGHLSPFVPQTSPEAVVENLVASYQVRNIEEYSRLLAPEFIFVFQPQNAQQLETEFWTRDQDTTGTDALFGTPLVSQITINLTHGDAVPTNEVDLPPGTMKIRINQVHLQVDQTDGITWRVVDIQDMFFRPGDPDRGENPDLWFLMEWRDIPTNLAPQGASVQSTTWGLIKTLYLEP